MRYKAIIPVSPGSVLLGFLFVVVIVIGPLFDLTVPVADVAAACAMLVLLGMAFGSLALAVGCATGKKSLAYGATCVVAVAAYVLNIMDPSVSALG